MTEMFESLSNDSFRHREKNDCAVKAVALATGKPYAKVLAMFTARGRRPRRGTPTYITTSVLRSLGYELVDCTSSYPGAKTPISAARVMPQQRGVFLIRTRRHILCYRGGKIHDWTAGRRHRILTIYRVKRMKGATV